jgi:tRNA wybutosine-synthesizing protein 3
MHRFRNSLSRRLSTSDETYPSAPVHSPLHLSKQTTSTNGVNSKDVSSTPRGIPKSFATKKAKIMADLNVPGTEYADKSPKGSVDEGVQDVIALINGQEGWVSTSSCAGRVSVFVEGRRVFPPKVDSDYEDGLEDTEVEGDSVDRDEEEQRGRTRKRILAGPGGKGGGRWLYVSHEPVPASSATGDQDEEADRHCKLFGLEPASPTSFPASASRRLIHLSFSPLILHIFCASLHHAKPLLTAAIAAGFRESGVQSLKSLDDQEAGVMVAIRTAGLVFDSVVGVVIEGDDESETMQGVVGEGYLQFCTETINEKFVWNQKRKERLTVELEKARKSLEDDAAEEREEQERWNRNRDEGLRKQQELQTERTTNPEKDGVAEDVLENGLDLPADRDGK